MSLDMYIYEYNNHVWQLFFAHFEQSGKNVVNLNYFLNIVI